MSFDRQLHPICSAHLLLLAIAVCFIVLPFSRSSADTFTYSTEFDNATDFDDFVFFNEDVFYDDDQDSVDEFGLPNPNATPEVLTPDGEWQFLPDEPEPELNEDPKPGGGTGVLRLVTGLTHANPNNSLRGGAGDNSALIQVSNPTGQLASLSTTWTQEKHSFSDATFFSLLAYGNRPYSSQGVGSSASDYPENVAELDDSEYYEFTVGTRSSEFEVRKRFMNDQGTMVFEKLGDTIDLDPDEGTRARFDISELSIEGNPLRENTISLTVTRTMVPDGLGGMVDGLQFDASFGVWYGNSNEAEGNFPDFIEQTFTRYDASADLLMGEYFGIRENRESSGAGTWEYDFLDFDLEVDVDSASVPPGDYNGDGMVNLADYTVWRDNLGAATEESLNGVGDNMNGVDAGDYQLWKQQFGAAPLQTIVATAVPEPTAALLCFSLVLALPATWKCSKCTDRTRLSK